MNGTDLSLEQSTQLFRLLSDSTRLRLLQLLTTERLSVAELTDVLGLAQGRVSSHLAKLREAELVTDEREGSSVFYKSCIDTAGSGIRDIYTSLARHLEDSDLSSDRESAAQIVAARGLRNSWADSVAGRMEKQYSPGRTWEATARALCGLLNLGDVLDIGSGDGVLAELLAPHAGSVTCIDYSETVVAAARDRLQSFANVSIEQGDMHSLPFGPDTFDQVFLMHVLTYTRDAEKVIDEAVRVLKPAGDLTVVTLASHDHHATVANYDHVNKGFSTAALEKWLKRVPLTLESCEITSRETRPPYFEIITAMAHKTG